MILCCGEALIDMLPRVSQAGEPAFAPLAGGAVFNTSIALGRLGVASGFLSGISTDLFGAQLVDALAASNVDASLCIRSDRPTTLAFVTLTDGHAKYAFYDENTAGRMITAADMPKLPDTVDALFFGGISLVADPAADAYAALMLREAATRVTMIDPNIRPDFITDEPAFRARLMSMLGVADIVKISDEDLEWIGVSIEDLLEMGVKLVCLTEGAKGVTGYFGAGQLSAPSKRVEVVDTVGAGDTFNAGLLAGLARDGLLSKGALASLSSEALRPALELGASAAAITVSRAGANPPWQHELE
ncbi:MAG: carbohydrate kinase family protein [Maritimibacter sp.]